MKMQNILRALVQQYAPKSAKKYLWDHEFSSGRWNFLDKIGDERGHPQIEKYAAKGHILDLGCGSGTTSVELDATAYISYTGVDISNVAVEKAKIRAQEAGRESRNAYHQSDIFTYIPQRKYEVILFGDSIYYFPHNQVHLLLMRYSKYLASDGVFLVRMFDANGKHGRILEIIESHYQVCEKELLKKDSAEACIIAFRPSDQTARTA